ncbi:hypothetical protein V2E24_01290 [Mycoplasmopsis ciconiae]|uniref:Uncharacterized protein n=1 Tax=Mycoplasmopsis ciconiae TaxID=561067 RepID=A0ABU7MKZ8_9BACT|nr:hypothetical protein [Mycoplasmopsis ciconiae]
MNLLYKIQKHFKITKRKKEFKSSFKVFDNHLKNDFIEEFIIKTIEKAVFINKSTLVLKNLNKPSYQFKKVWFKIFFKFLKFLVIPAIIIIVLWNNNHFLEYLSHFLEKLIPFIFSLLEYLFVISIVILILFILFSVYLILRTYVFKSVNADDLSKYNYVAIARYLSRHSLRQNYEIIYDISNLSVQNKQLFKFWLESVFHSDSFFKLKNLKYTLVENQDFQPKILDLKNDNKIEFMDKNVEFKLINKNKKIVVEIFEKYQQTSSTLIINLKASFINNKLVIQRLDYPLYESFNFIEVLLEILAQQAQKNNIEQIEINTNIFKSFETQMWWANSKVFKKNLNNEEIMTSILK